MRIGAYSFREDEKEYFETYGKKYGVEIQMIRENPVPETVDLAAGCQCISIITNTYITKDMLDRYKELGVRFISTRTIGMEHIDVEYAGQIGIGVDNISYTPDSVAEYAVMLMLMVLRNTKTMEIRSKGQDYAISKIRGRLISDLTVGIIGTGRIGARVAAILTGFGCRILACDPYENPSLGGIAEYVPLETMYRESDILTLHAPSTQDNYHMIGGPAFEQMKDQAVIINTARGDLIDSKALIAALESGKIGGAGLDLIEGDRLIYYRDLKGQIISHHDMAILQFMPNVVLLPHMAFYTDHSVSDMVENSIKSCAEYVKNAVSE